MRQKKLLITVLFIVMTILTAAFFYQKQRENGFITFHSNNIVVPADYQRNFPGITKEIIQRGIKLSFQVEYPPKWKAENNLGGVGLFSAIFYPRKTELSKIKSHITIDLLADSSGVVTKLFNNDKAQLKNELSNFSRKEFTLNKDTLVYKIIGKNKGIYQGIALIKYKDKELYRIVTFFSENNINNLKIFNHMVYSFRRG